MLAICTTTYTILNNKEGRNFLEKFLSVYEYDGSKVEVIYEEGVIKISINYIRDTVEIEKSPIYRRRRLKK